MNFAAGETKKQASIYIMNDYHDEVSVTVEKCSEEPVELPLRVVACSAGRVGLEMAAEGCRLRG